MNRKREAQSKEAIVVAGELASILELAESIPGRLESFMEAYRSLVRRYIHSRPLFFKFLADQFVYVYESSSPSFARNILHSAMVLEGAFREAIANGQRGVNGLQPGSKELKTLQIGLSAGRVFRIPESHRSREDIVGLPLLAARQLAEDATTISSHILVDTDMGIDRVCREWLSENSTEPDGLEVSDGGNAVTGHIVTPSSMFREYEQDADRYQVIGAAETAKRLVDEIARPHAFSFRLTQGESPHLELVFNPSEVRQRVDRTVAVSLLLVHLQPQRLTVYPEILVPMDRVYTVQLPIPITQDEYRLVLGLAIQAPHADLVEHALERIEETPGIVERLNRMISLLDTARASHRLALAYYRF